MATTAQTVAVAPQAAIMARLSEPDRSKKVPDGLMARCALRFTVAGISSVEWNGFAYWKDDKSGKITVSLPGGRFPELLAAKEIGEFKGKQVEYDDPDGVDQLAGLTDALMGCYHAWRKSGQARQAVTINATPTR